MRLAGEIMLVAIATYLIPAGCFALFDLLAMLSGRRRKP